SPPMSKRRIRSPSTRRPGLYDPTGRRFSTCFSLPGGQGQPRAPLTRSLAREDNHGSHGSDGQTTAGAHRRPDARLQEHVGRGQGGYRDGGRPAAQEGARGGGQEGRPGDG